MKGKMKLLSHVRLFGTPWTTAYQASPSMGFSRQECWSGLPFPSPGHLPDPGIEPGSPALEADALTSEPPGKQNHKGREPEVRSQKAAHLWWRIFQTCVEHYLDPWVRKISWRRKWLLTPVYLPGKILWTEGLAGYSPQDHIESGHTSVTKRTHT